MEEDDQILETVQLNETIWTKMEMEALYRGIARFGK